MRPSTIIVAPCAVALTAAATAGCGGVPGSAVATVDGESIDKDHYDRWLTIATRSAKKREDKGLRARATEKPAVEAVA